MVFDHDDIGKSVWTMGSKIYVADSLRSEVGRGIHPEWPESSSEL